jgi:hypothetical protein
VLNNELVPPNNINVSGHTNNIVSAVLNSQCQFSGIFIKQPVVNHYMNKSCLLNTGSVCGRVKKMINAGNVT